jgi:S-methylmethionine-dependent homocysteine/selenocysteine methylase
MLDGEHDMLLKALDRVRGHTEWGLKVLADPRRLVAAIHEHGAGSSGTFGARQETSSGRAFFARKKLESAAQEEAQARAQAAAQQAHDRLRRKAAAATLLPPQHPELSKRSGHMVLNGAYLVHRSRVEEFTAAARELGEQHRGEGLELELSGPWPPYNFSVRSEAQR